MRKKMVTLCSGDVSLPSCSFQGELHFFKIILNIVQNGDHICISLDVERGEEIDSLVLLVEIRVVVGPFEFFIDKDMLSKTEQLWTTGIRKCRGAVLVQARLLDILPTCDITQPSRLRKTQVLCYNSVYYVDIERLADIGGYLFIEWKKIKDEGQPRIVSTIDERDLDVLFTAVIKHDFITVHRRNYLQLCEIGEKYRILPLLRAVEQFLMDAHIHPMRRLELSVEMRMARLYDLGLRQMGAPHIALKKLHQYLAQNGESINDIHPKLLSALQINPDYICIS